ncbi:hypothetical protein LUZ60_010302 [Juncus effusus]|nr:hypothetical protein LUZ60_010302 [Juncus effusus]
MATNSAPPANSPPPKPWERAGSQSQSGPTPFRPPSAGNTSEIVEASGTAKPGEVVPAVNRTGSGPVNNALARPVPPRPWQQNYGTAGAYGGVSGYGSGGMYGSSNLYGSGYGSSSLYGSNSMYGSGYGSSSLYGSGYGSGMSGFGSGMYGSGMYGSGAGYGMGGMGGMGPYGGAQPDPNNPYGGAQPPGFWMSFLRVMSGVVNFFGRIAVLIDQNTQAFHMFMTALLQLFDRSGMLYGELARFVFRLFGIRTRPRKSVDGPGAPAVEGAKPNNWDNVWGNDFVKGAE